MIYAINADHMLYEYGFVLYVGVLFTVSIQCIAKLRHCKELAKLSEKAEKSLFVFFYMNERRRKKQNEKK